MDMRLLVATRKGLFTWERKSSGWDLAGMAFIGDPVSSVLHDARDDTFMPL